MSRSNTRHSAHFEERPLSGEQRLIFAMLERAMLDLNLPDPDPRRTAAWWFRRRDLEPFSFVWCCQAIGWDVRTVRKRITSGIALTEG